MAVNSLNVLSFNSERELVSYSLSENRVEAVETSALRGSCDISVAIFNDKEVISYSFDAEKGMSKEELDDTVEIRMFQDAGLNHMIDYKIVYTYRDSLLDAKSITVTAMAATNTDFVTEFAKFRQKCTYIDAIIPFSTLPFALYNAEILEKKSDIFIYLREKDATVSVFFEGDYIYAKNVTTGLKMLYEAFVRNNNENVSYEDFTTALVQKGLDESRYSIDDNVQFHDINMLLEAKLLEMNNIFSYARRIAGIQSFNRVFIGTELGTIPNITQLIKSVTGISGHDYLFYTDFFLEDSIYIDQNIILSQLECQNIMGKKGANPFNLTIYPRPPEFLKRESGRFFAASAAAFAISMLYPLYLYVDSSWMVYSQNQIIEKLNISKSEFLQIKSEEDEHKLQKSRYESMVQAEKEALSSKMSLLNEIKLLKADKKPRIVVLEKIFKTVNANNLSIEKLEFSDNRYRIDLHSAKDDFFTSFLISLSNFEEFDAEMSLYTFDSTLNKYKTSVTIKVGS